MLNGAYGQSKQIVREKKQYFHTPCSEYEIKIKTKTQTTFRNTRKSRKNKLQRLMTRNCFRKTHLANSSAASERRHQHVASPEKIEKLNTLQ